MYEILVRIVTCNAADAGVGSAETFAVGEPVGLEADVHFAPPMTPDNHVPGAMALSTIVGDALG
jgi:hypothetical protein